MEQPNLQSILIQAVHDGLKRRKWSQRELARRVPVTHEHIHNLMTGKREGTLSMWTALLKALGCDITIIVCMSDRAGAALAQKVR